jgi:hypothetical protein
MAAARGLATSASVEFGRALADVIVCAVLHSSRAVREASLTAALPSLSSHLRSKVVRKSIARVLTVYRASLRTALRSKIAEDGANKKGKVRMAAVLAQPSGSGSCPPAPRARVHWGLL